MRIQNLLKWYLINQRDLPWRRTNNPYIIWLSEVVLQQTRVEQGIPYFLRITDKYPTIQKLARAKKDDFFKLWQGLGYYNRAENLLQTASHIHTQLNDEFPNTFESLQQLKGIGPYTAAAIASIAFEESVPVVDGNVIRVISRLFAIQEPVNTSPVKKQIEQLAEELIIGHQPSVFNQAMMELGALICKPTQPLCHECPLQTSCLAAKQKLQQLIPKKNPKKKPVQRSIHYIVFKNTEQTLIQKRTGNAIWKNLYEPPNFDTDKPLQSGQELLSHLLEKGFIDSIPKKMTLHEGVSFKHLLSHQTIFGTFWIIENGKPSSTLQNQCIQVDWDALHSYPVHRLFDKFLNYIKLQSC